MRFVITVLVLLITAPAFADEETFTCEMSLKNPDVSSEIRISYEKKQPKKLLMGDDAAQSAAGKKREVAVIYEGKLTVMPSVHKTTGTIVSAGPREYPLIVSQPGGENADFIGTYYDSGHPVTVLILVNEADKPMAIFHPTRGAANTEYGFCSQNEINGVAPDAK